MIHINTNQLINTILKYIYTHQNRNNYIIIIYK